MPKDPLVMAVEPESFKVVSEVENHDGGHLICLLRVDRKSVV